MPCVLSSLTLLDGRADLRSPWETVGLPRPPSCNLLSLQCCALKADACGDCVAALRSPSLLHFEMFHFFENGHEIYIFKSGRQAVTDERRVLMPQAPPPVGAAACHGRFTHSVVAARLCCVVFCCVAAVR